MLLSLFLYMKSFRALFSNWNCLQLHRWWRTPFAVTLTICFAVNLTDEGPGPFSSHYATYSKQRRVHLRMATLWDNLSIASSLVLMPTPLPSWPVLPAPRSPCQACPASRLDRQLRRGDKYIYGSTYYMHH